TRSYGDWFRRVLFRSVPDLLVDLAVVLGQLDPEQTKALTNGLHRFEQPSLVVQDQRLQLECRRARKLIGRAGDQLVAEQAGAIEIGRASWRERAQTSG